MDKIMRVPTGAFKILEYPEFATEVLGIVEKHDPETMKIQGVVNLFKEQLLEVDKITVFERSHPITKELILLRNERDMTLSAIGSLSTGFNKVKVPAIKEAALLALPVLNKFLNKIYQNSNFVKNKKIDLMLAEIDSNVELNDAMQTLGLRILLDELRANFLLIVEKQENRRQVKSVTPKLLTKKIILNCSSAMTNLFRTIEISQLTEQGVDYLHLVNELNEMLSEYKTLLTQRKTLTQKSATKKTAALSVKTTATV